MNERLKRLLFLKLLLIGCFKKKKDSFLYSDHLCPSGASGISTMEGKKIERSVLVTPAPVSIPSSNALPSLSSKVAPSLLVFLPSLSLSLHTSKQVSLSLWGIETLMPGALMFHCRVSPANPQPVLASHPYII